MKKSNTQNYIIIFIFLLVLMLGVISCGNKTNRYDKNVNLISFRDQKSKKYGYKDLKGNIVIKPKYDFAFSFSEGLGCVEQNNKYGYISSIYKFVIKPTFHYARPFSEGLAYVIPDKKSYFMKGYINNEGKFILPPQEFIPPGSRFLFRGEVSLFDFHEGLARVTVQYFNPINLHENQEIDKKCGFISKEGKYAIIPKFVVVRDFSDGMAAIQTEEDGYWGFINKKGDIVIEPRYNQVSDFHNGKAWVVNNQNIFFINKKNKKVKVNYTKELVNKKVTRESDTPLMLAAKANKIGPVKFLLSKGADPNNAEEGDFTPLMIAAINANQEITKILLEHGAAPNAITSCGTPVLVYASSNIFAKEKIQNLKKLLRKYGAKTPKELEAEKKKKGNQSDRINP